MEEKPKSPHILIFPLPCQSHVNSMLKLAEIFSLAGLKVTFLNSKHNHERLIRYTDIHDRFLQYSEFQFKTISDGLPADHPRAGDRLMEMFDSLSLNTRPLLKQMLIDTSPPVSCIIGDACMEFVVDVATELEIPVIHFRAISACSFWAYFSIPEMIQAGELPMKAYDEDMDRLITKVPGMETFLRFRDLPSFCRVSDVTDRDLQVLKNATQQSPRAHALILNTFEDLEEPILSHIRTKCPKVYTIGPLHLQLKTRLASNMISSSSQKSPNSLWEVDRSCIEWLGKQPVRSVLYVSFGSITLLKREQLIEFWHGLVDSKQRFLWVIRPDSVIGEGDAPAELVEGTKERGLLVSWVPQEEVLAHQAVAGFLTHSGWNSTLESIVAGVPMICWPYFADQQINSRFVSEVWNLGLDMKDVCDRNVVEKMVNDLMVERKEEFMRAADRMATMARTTANEGGPSYCNLDRLIDDIKMMSSQA
ncbi:hypothetical protein WN943_017989 [Citrus x changshan-huyou]